MKRNPIRYMLLLLPVLLLAGCQNPLDDHGPDAGSPTTFTATIEGGDGTKTTLGDPDAEGVRAVKWSDNDAISISGATYTVSSGATTTTATFTGSGATLSEGKYKAYYPASVYNGGSPSLPAVQTYSSTRIDNLPMYAESATTTLQFYNLCAVLEFKLTGSETVGSIGLKSTEGKKLSGAFTPQNWASDSRSVVMSESASDTVTLNCGTSGVTLNATTPKSFFIAVPAQDYSLGTLKVTVKKLNGDEITSFTNSAGILSALRSKIYDISKSAKQPFSVTYGGTMTSSTGTPVTASGTITGGATYTNPKTHSFTVTSDMGYKVTISAPTAAYTDKQSDPTAGGVVTMTVNRYSDKYRIGGISEFRRDALFSVSATQQVYFSPGNLQYRAKRADGVTTYESANTFRFAERQYDVVGCRYWSLDGNVFTDDLSGFWDNLSISHDYTGWIDLFGWGTSGKVYEAARYMPYEYLPPASDYGPLSGDLTGDSDWGAADIWDGATLIPGGTYRTLTRAEWIYLVSQRNVLADGWCSSQVAFSSAGGPDTFTFQITFEAYDDPSYSVTYNVTARKKEDWRGLLIFPDNFADTDLISRAGLTYAGSTYLHFKVGSRTDLDVNLWPEFERAGCVFLPALPGSIRYYDSVYGQHYSVDHDAVMYWTASPYDQTYGYGFRSGADNLYASCNKYGGLAVRLVKDVPFTGGNGTNSPYTPGGSGGF